MIEQPKNELYSSVWFETFMDTIPADQTAREVAFLERQLPLTQHRSILDLCCGSGRHAIPLARHGYDVTGVDRDRAAIDRARAASIPGATFIEADVRSAVQAPGTWNAVIIMWASFGYFAPEQNRAVLAHVLRSLTPGGRLVLDVYNREWFTTHQGEHRMERGGLNITETKQLVGDRLHVELRYDGHDVVDRFSWQVFTAPELADALRDAGFRVVTQCAAFDERVAAAANQPRMQVIAERIAAEEIELRRVSEVDERHGGS